MNRYTPVVAVTALLLGWPGIAAATWTWYYTDALGSPVAATDQSGAVVWRARYHPFGHRVQSAASYTGSLANPLWFGGHMDDAVSGLVYMQARHYSIASGRFVSVDPAPFRDTDPQSFNRYSYAHNNPMRYVDPDGRESVLISLRGTAFAGAGGTVSLGLYLSFPLGDSTPFDAGIVLTGGLGAGADLSVTGNLSLLDGGRENVEGMMIHASGTVPLTGIAGPVVSAEALVNPVTSEMAGTSIGMGLGLLPAISGGLSYSTVLFSLRDALAPSDETGTESSTADSEQSYNFYFYPGLAL